MSLRAPLWVALAVLAATAGAAVLLSLWAGPVDALPFQLKNRDFANYWMAGKLILEGKSAVLFGPPAGYFEAMKSVFGADYPWHNWSYPPHAALLLLPLGLVGYLPGMALFLGVTFALYILALGSLRPHWTPIGCILLAGFVAANIMSTQNGFLTTALLVGGLALRDRRPLVAGVLFGLLTFKPQLGILLPLLLLHERRWLVIAAAVVSGILMVIASVVAFGFDSWHGYFTFIAPYQTEIMKTFGGDFPHMMGSAFGSARSLGFDAASAMWIHLPFALAGFGLFALALFKLDGLHARAFVTLIASMLIVPYSVAYDFGPIATFAALWPLAGRQDPPALAVRILMILLAVLPIAMLPLGKAGLPLTPLLLLAAGIAVLMTESRLRLSETSSSLPRPSTALPG